MLMVCLCMSDVTSISTSTMSHVGNIIVTQINLLYQSKLILATIYVHQRVSYSD